MSGGGRRLLRDHLAARLVLDRGRDAVTREVAAGRRHVDVELQRLRLVVEQHAAEVGIEHEDVGGRRLHLLHDDVVEPRRARRVVVVLEHDGHRLVGGEDDRAEGDLRPVVGAGEEIGRRPREYAARPLVERQPHAGVVAAEALGLHPGRHRVRARLELNVLGRGRGAGVTPIAEGTGAFRQLILRPARAGRPARGSQRLEAGILGEVRSHVHLRQRGEAAADQGRRLGARDRRRRRHRHHRNQDPSHPTSHLHPPPFGSRVGLTATRKRISQRPAKGKGRAKPLNPLIYV